MQFRILLLICFLCNPSNIYYAEKVTIQGILRNGTTGGEGRADEAKLIALQGGMEPLAQISNLRNKFVFPQIEIPEGIPILLQVTYLGVNYNKMIPPTIQFRQASQEVTVYESVKSKGEIASKGLMQLIREKNGVRIFKLFLLTNTSEPKVSLLQEAGELDFFIPKEAVESYVGLQQPGSKMSIPLEYSRKDNGRTTWTRAILPGTSELQISYLMPLDTWDEEFLLESKGVKFPVFVKPEDMKLEILSGGKLSKFDKEEVQGLSGYGIVLDSTSKRVTLRATGGKPQTNQGRGNAPEIINGSFLVDTNRSILAVLAFFALFLSFGFYVLYRKSYHLTK